MKMRVFSISLIIAMFFPISLKAASGEISSQKEMAQIILQEWNAHISLVGATLPDGDIGGYMLYKEFGDQHNFTLLWRVGELVDGNEVIRFFRKRPLKNGNDDGQVFAVTYHKSKIIVPGSVVLRRFIGAEPTGWSSYTIDFVSGEYLGHQGELSIKSKLTKEEKKALKTFGIQVF